MSRRAIVDGLRIQQGIDKRLAVSDRKFELLMLLDRPPRSVLDARQHEISDRPPLQSRGPFDKGLLLRRYSGLEALRAGTAARGFQS